MRMAKHTAQPTKGKGGVRSGGKKAKKYYVNGRPVDKSKRKSKGSKAKAKQGGFASKLKAAGMMGVAAAGARSGVETTNAADSSGGSSSGQQQPDAAAAIAAAARRKKPNKPRRPTHKGFAARGYSQALPKATRLKSGNLADKILAMRAAQGGV